MADSTISSAFSWDILFNLVFQWDWISISISLRKNSWKFWPTVSISSIWTGKHNWKMSRLKQADRIGGQQPNYHLEKVLSKENFGEIANKGELQERLIRSHSHRSSWKKCYLFLHLDYPKILRRIGCFATVIFFFL